MLTGPIAIPGRLLRAAFKMAKAGEVRLGGRLVHSANPRWECLQCHAGFGRLAGTG
jgi:hypothetical protein